MAMVSHKMLLTSLIEFGFTHVTLSMSEHALKICF
jgi:hypothetical protein